MTDVQLYLAIGLPMIAVLTSLTVSLVQISGIGVDGKCIRAEIRGIRDDLRGVRDDMREIRSDIKLLTGKVYELMGQK
jgi:hypothetical protein